MGQAPGLGTNPVQIHQINSSVPFTLFPGETVNIGSHAPAPTPVAPSAQVAASYTPSSDAVAHITALQESLIQQNTMIQQLMGQKDF